MTLRKFEEGNVILSLPEEYGLKIIDMGPFMTGYNIHLAIIFVVMPPKKYSIYLYVS